MGKEKDDANAALHRHGAPPKPFDYATWTTRLFEVLKGALEEALDETLAV